MTTVAESDGGSATVLSDHGSPTMSAGVTYSGTGYRQFMGWIQIVRTTRTRPTDQVVDATEVDMNATWNDKGNPFFAYGYPAAIYDAPSNNLNGAQRLDWRADTFLTTVPLRSRAEPIVPVAAFSWGYRETSDPGDVPSILIPAEIGLDAWAEHADLLRADLPDWTWG